MKKAPPITPIKARQYAVIKRGILGQLSGQINNVCYSDNNVNFANGNFNKHKTKKK